MGPMFAGLAQGTSFTWSWQSPCVLSVVLRASALPDSAFACSEAQNHPGSGLQALGLKLLTLRCHWA